MKVTRRPAAPPMLEGRVKSISATAPAAGDVPWWAQSIGILAILSVVLALFALFALRTILKAVSSSRRQGLGTLSGGLLGGGSGSRGSGLFSRTLFLSGVAGVIGYRLGRRDKSVEHSLLLIAAAEGDIPCRYPTAPSMLPLAIGDSVELSGRRYPDNTARAWRFRNLSTGVSHRARIVAPWAPVAAIVSLVIYLYVAALVLAQG